MKWKLDEFLLPPKVHYSFWSPKQASNRAQFFSNQMCSWFIARGRHRMIRKFITFPLLSSRNLYLSFTEIHLFSAAVTALWSKWTVTELMITQQQFKVPFPFTNFLPKKVFWCSNEQSTSPLQGKYNKTLISPFYWKVLPSPPLSRPRTNSFSELLHCPPVYRPSYLHMAIFLNTHSLPTLFTLNNIHTWTWTKIKTEEITKT